VIDGMNSEKPKSRSSPSEKICRPRRPVIDSSFSTQAGSFRRSPTVRTKRAAPKRAADVARHAARDQPGDVGDAGRRRATA